MPDRWVSALWTSACGAVGIEDRDRDGAFLYSRRLTRLMDKPLWGLRVDGPSGRRFLRGLSLTRLWREGCGGRPYGRQYKCCLAALDCPTAQRGEGGAVRHQRGESHRRWLITVVLTMPYDTESKSRNADFISIARRAIHNPRPEGPSNLRTLRPRAGPS